MADSPPAEKTVLQLQRQPTDEQDQDNNHSTKTIRALTPLRDLIAIESKSGGVNQKEATTPVVVTPQYSSSKSRQPVALPDPAIKQHVFRRDTRGRGGSYRTADSHKLTRKNIGIVIGDFAGLFPDELTLKIGERIEIICKDTVVSRNIGWWAGRNQKGKIGIFPAACIKLIASSSDASEISLTHEYPLEIPPGEVEMKEVIGVGGFGKVHRALYKGHEVAVKVAKHTTFDSLKAVQDVISEAEKFAHLAHQNVCALVGVVLVKDVCLVMEYSRGGALSEILHKRAISIPINVILDWSVQIAAGMSYLHHEAHPSLIHRDLKSSNILLSNQVDPDNLSNNTIKITDFGLAREIEHTTQMSGAGTYPWMAPEVIRSSDFSKKSDVWSFGVVLWELLTGERPYGGLNLFVVAYGVGHGTLTLPIPESCPRALGQIMSDCWVRAHSSRPSFVDIQAKLKEVESESFFSATSHEEFRSIQTSWKEEIQRNFIELKRIESQLKEKEEAMVEEMQKQAQKLKEKEIELAKAKDDLRKQQEMLDRELERRPPRLKKFSLRKLIKWLSGEEGKTPGPLPNQMKPKRSSSHLRVNKQYSLNQDALPSELSPSMHVWEKRSSLPSHPITHRRRRSDDLEDFKEQLPNVSTSLPARRRGSSPSPSGGATHAQYSACLMKPPGLTAVQKLDDSRRSRSISDPRSPSPHQLLPHVSPPRSPNAKQVSTSSIAPIQSAVVAVGHSAAKKPVQLSFRPKPPFSSVDSSPGSPMVTITSADHQYDSGKDSMTCSDASGHSNCSEHQLIKLESPPVGAANKTFELLSEFDPLERQSPSHDSGKTSGNCSPSFLSTSPQASIAPPKSPKTLHTSPRTSLNLETSLGPSPTIIRPRPKRPMTLKAQTSEVSLPISAPSSRPHSPKPTYSRHKSNSPTGSVHSLVQYPTNYDSDYGALYIGSFQSDSDATSTTSSLLDINMTDDAYDPHPILLPTTADTDLFSFTMNYN